MIENPATHLKESRIDALLSLGFESIGKSNLYQKGDFVVSVDSSGKYKILVDFDNRRPQNIKGVKKDKYMGTGSFCLVIWYEVEGDEELFIQRTLNGSGGGMWGREPNKSDFNGTLDEQLLKAGFVQDPQDEKVFRQTIEEYEKSTEVTAIIKNGVIHKLLKPTVGLIGDKIDANTTITDYHEVDADTFSKKRRVGALTLSNSLMSFDVTTEYGGRLVQDSQRLHKDINPEDLSIEDFVEVIEPSGFKVGGVNTTEQIKKLTSIAGKSIQELEAIMRPFRSSTAGFLGDNESLLDVLASDNDFVLSQGLTHQDLAKQLKFVKEIYFKCLGNTFGYEGRKYQIETTVWRGPQESPFGDNTWANSDVRVTNLTNGASFYCSFLLADLIERYGFYEGKGTSYRLEPSAILEVFDFLKRD